MERAARPLFFTIRVARETILARDRGVLDFDPERFLRAVIVLPGDREALVGSRYAAPIAAGATVRRFRTCAGGVLRLTLI
jgi:hypothetical protein